MIIPQVRPFLGQDEADAASRAILENWITEGPRSAELSAALNAYISVPHGVFAPNGTLALALGLMALGIEAGDEVLIPDCTFIGSANAVIMLGAVPIFTDVDPVHYQIDLSDADRLVTARTKAVMPVHLYGTSCDMAAVMEFAARHGLKVIEDAAQSIGVTYAGRHVGGIGDVGCFSFFADKTMVMGEGGYVTCRDEAVFDRLRLLRNQGRFDRGSFIHPMIGFNFRITDIQAAIGLVQFRKLDRIIDSKAQVYRWYQEMLADMPQITMLGAEKSSNLVPFRCVLIARDAHGLMRHLDSRGIQTRGFFYPLHKQPCFDENSRWRQGTAHPPSLEDAAYPNAISGFNNGVCLPIYPDLSRDEVAYIASEIRSFYG